MKTFSEKLAGAVIGLVRGCDGNMDLVTADTEKIITEGIITAFYGSDEEISSCIKKIHDEKYRIVPDCAVCKNPCGRTFDYNFKDLSLDGEDVACLKMLLLNSVVGYLMILKEKAGNSGIEKSDFAPIYGALYAVGGKDWSADLILRPFFRVGGKAFEVVSAEERFKTCAKVLLTDFDLKKEFSDTEKVKNATDAAGAMLMPAIYALENKTNISSSPVKYDICPENPLSAILFSALTSVEAGNITICGKSDFTDNVKKYFAENYGVKFR